MSNDRQFGAAIGTGILAGTTADTFTYNGASVTDTSTLVYNTANRYQISDTSAPHNIVFHGPGGKEVGRFDFSDGDFKFEGDASKSAKVFVEWARKNWSDLRDKDRVEVLDAVIHDIIAESSGELYSEEEKVAMLTCLQIVQGQKNTYVAPQVESSRGYAQNLAKSMQATKEAVAQSVLGAIAPEGKSL